MPEQYSSKQPFNMVILGGGTAGWMAAAALVKLLPKSLYSITLVESEQIGTVGVGEATFPTICQFNAKLGFDEIDFMKATNATFKAGIEFQHWANIGDKYIHPFGAYGSKINGIPFYHFWLKAKSQGDTSRFDDYSFCVKACEANKFKFPSKNPQDIDSTFGYAYHLDAGLYAKYLRDFAEPLGLTRIEGKVVNVVTDNQQNITELALENGNSVTGDFFIDCTGFRAQLIGKTLGVEFEDWSHWLPCNRAIAIGSEHGQRLAPYTKSIARDAGWQWQIPLQHRMGNGYVYCDQYASQDQALDTLLSNLPGKAITEPNFLSFTSGRRKQPWKNNCLAIGLASGFFEPLESTSIYLIQQAIMKFVELIPTDDDWQIQAQEFNRTMDIEVRRIRDFLILHYHVNNRQDTEFWRDLANMEVPESLKQRMEMFKKTGHIQTYRTGAFFESSWTAVYFGQKFYPDNYDARLVNVDVNAFKKLLSQTKDVIAQSVHSLSSHEEFLQNAGCMNTTEVNFSSLK